VYDVAPAAQVLRFFGELDWLEWFMPSACLIGSGMEQQLLFRGLGPLFALISVPFVHALGDTAVAIKHRRERKLEFRKTFAYGLVKGLPPALVLSFCFTPVVSATIFRAWHCVHFDYDGNEEWSYLVQDLSVRCYDSDAHKEVLTVAWFMVAIWPIGMVLIYGAVLYPCRFALLDESKPNVLLEATSFLHRDYKNA
jgi:hypothetical protein